jgi:hypothetical protein
MRYIRCALGLALALGACGCGVDLMAADVRFILDSPDDFELISLDPDHEAPKAKDQFHGWNVLGKVSITDRGEQATLRQALYQGVRENKDGMVAGCFIPRHGLRVTRDGKTVELVICFQCMSMQVFGVKTRSLLTTSSPANVFNEVLRDKGVPLPTK